MFLINPYIHTKPIRHFTSDMVPGVDVEESYIPGFGDIIKEGAITPVTGLLNFDGIDDYVSFASTPDVTGGKIIRFKIYVEEFAGFGGVITIRSGDDMFVIYRSNYIFSIYVRGNDNGSNGGFNFYFDDIGQPVVPYNTKLEIIVDKSAKYINSISINGAMDQGVMQNNGLITSVSGFEIGRFASQYIGGILIWGLEIDGVPIATGHPDGNLDSAWSQDSAATVYGSPTTIDL